MFFKQPEKLHFFSHSEIPFAPDIKLLNIIRSGYNILHYGKKIKSFFTFLPNFFVYVNSCFLFCQYIVLELHIIRNKNAISCNISLQLSRLTFSKTHYSGRESMMCHTLPVYRYLYFILNQL